MILFRRIEPGSFRFFIRKVRDQVIIPLYFVPAVAHGVSNLPVKKEAKGVAFKTDLLFCTGECCKKSCIEIPLKVDHLVVPVLPDGFQELQEILLFSLFFVPHQHFKYVGIVQEQFFIPFSYEVINPGTRKMPGQLLSDGGTEHYITDKRGLYDQEFLHGAKLDQNIPVDAALIILLQKINIMELQQLVEEAWKDRNLLKEQRYDGAVREVIEKVDKGILRTATPAGDGWQVNEWVKQAILMYFAIQKMETHDLPPFEFHDKMKLKSGYAAMGVRAVPHAVARYGAYLAPNVVLMPSYVNIGAYVGEGTMVDTWATVGSCAQIGAHVHLSGGVGIGGVLEPLQASPVIIEDGCFIGSRCIVVEGVRVRKEAVLGANVVLTQSTRIIDVSGSEPVEMKGEIPERSVVIPGTYPKKFPAGEYGVSCALIIGKRKASTDQKTSLNDALRDFNVAV